MEADKLNSKGKIKKGRKLAKNLQKGIRPALSDIKIYFQAAIIKFLVQLHD